MAENGDKVPPQEENQQEDGPGPSLEDRLYVALLVDWTLEQRQATG